MVVTGPYRGEYRYIPHIIAAEFSAKVPSAIPVIRRADD